MYTVAHSKFEYCPAGCIVPTRLCLICKDSIQTIKEKIEFPCAYSAVLFNGENAGFLDQGTPPVDRSTGDATGFPGTCQKV
jgi:hypothetical protein